MTIGSLYILHRDRLGPPDDPYMVRYKLIETPWFAVRVHHILRSDGDRDLHDHPWSFVSIVLRGGYDELTPMTWRGDELIVVATRTITAPAVIYHRAEDLHRLELDRPAWTLVFTGPRRRHWGFQTRHGWVSWRTYLADANDA